MPFLNLSFSGKQEISISHDDSLATTDSEGNLSDSGPCNVRKRIPTKKSNDSDNQLAGQNRIPAEISSDSDNRMVETILQLLNRCKNK